MPSFTQRTYAGADDRAATLNLWLHTRAAGDVDPWPPLDRLQAELEARPHAQLWNDTQGDMIGCALLLDESVLVFCTRSGVDDEDLESEIVAWALARSAEAARQRGERPLLLVPVRDDDARLADLLARAGFSDDGLRTLRMERPLHAPIPAPRLPDGVRIRPISSADEVAAVAALYSQLLAGGRKTANDRAELMRAPGYRPNLDLVAILADGSVVGCVLGTCCVLERQHLAHAPGWLEFIGVDPAQHGHGIGAALSLHLLQAMRAEGLESVLLTTEGTNASTQRLFERCGFHTRHTIRWYVREPTRAWSARLWSQE
jgi:mycothiol synthase